MARNITDELKTYEEYSDIVGADIATFYCCLKFDIAYFPDIVLPSPNGTEVEWREYRIRAKQRGDGVTPHFLDGETDIRVAIQADDDSDLPGTARQRDKWGLGGDGELSYTSDDYNELDRIYKSLASDLLAQGTLNAKQDYILTNVSTLSLDMKRAQARGDMKEVKTINDTIQSMLSSENLRKKDAKPAENLRMDGVTSQLEKAGLLRDGKPVSPDEAFKLIFGRPCKYSYTMDAAEQMLLAIQNTGRRNDSLPEFSVLPEDMRLDDKLGEFAKEPNAIEQESYDKMGLLKMPPKGLSLEDIGKEETVDEETEIERSVEKREPNDYERLNL